MKKARIITTNVMKNSTILRLNFDRSKIHTFPSYQRLGDIWTKDKKQLLIDSILNDFDLPKLYLHVLESPKTLKNGNKAFLSIIDGRQRLETIWSFMDDEFALSKDFEFYKDPNILVANLKYSEMSKKYPELKMIFDSFVLPIVIVETDGIDLIEDMFSRLNEAVPLNAAEKRNAYGGPLPIVINNISTHNFFKECVKIHNTRYQHKEMSVRLLFIEKCLSSNKIIDTKKEYLDNFVRQFKKNPDLDGNALGISVKTILNEMSVLFNVKDPLLISQGRIPIYYALFRSAIQQGLITNITRQKFLKFNDLIFKNRLKAELDISDADFELLEFNRLSSQSTNDASGIKERIRIISKFFEITPPNFNIN